MTVTYTSKVASCKGFGCFWKLLLRWKGSIYKLVWPELLFYTALYYTCSATYRFVLDESQRRTFEKVAIYCESFIDLIPVSFVLGFYVSIVVQRWWDQYMSLPWPDSLALFVSTSIHGQDERSRLMRRTVMRYVNLTELITLIMISPTVKKRFPTLDHLVEAGFMTSNEKKIFDDLDAKTSHPKYWMPLVWAGSIVSRARKEGRIRDDFAVKTIIDEINRFRGLCGGLLSYDWISIPLVYTQVVTLAVYTFFLGTIMGRQFLDPAQNIPKHTLDFFVPVFTLLQFFFYMGWLKVAESLVNPFGEDDDDFEVNWLVDRNLQVSYLIVDEMHSEHPELIQDMYWDEIFPQELPYTVASEQFRREPPQGSTAHIEVPEPDQEFLPLLEEMDDEEDLQEERLGDVKVDMKNGTQAIDIMKKTGSIGSSISRMSSQTIASRKPSMLSMLMQKVKSGSHENMRRKSSKPLGSTTSMRHLRKQRGLMRSASRMSSSSQVCQSPESVARNPTILTQDSAIFRMSDLSLNTGHRDDAPSPRVKGRHPSCEDDEPILIKIKRRDNTGRVISPTSDEYDVLSESSRTHLLPNRQRKESERFSESIGDEVSDEADYEISIKGESQGSNASIRTSIFQGDGDEDDISMEERSESTIRKRRRGLNFRGALTKILSPTPSIHGDNGSTASLRSFSGSKSPVSGTPPYSKFTYPKYENQDSRSVSASEPVSPAHKSPVQQCRESRSLAALVHHQHVPGQSAKSPPQPVFSPVSKIHMNEPHGEQGLSHPFSGDFAMSSEELSPQKSALEEPEGTFMFHETDGAYKAAVMDEELHTVADDIIKTIPERHYETVGHLEPIAEKVSAGHLEPIAEKVPERHFESMTGGHLEPIAEKVPERHFESMTSGHLEPIAEKPFETMSTVSLEPIAEEKPKLEQEMSQEKENSKLKDELGEWV
ncbi:bestrophin-3-like isoform X2 [Penaeus japonicus]|uniref:bestrophin-3-like isoform X2 n=1 Tax=Penaeus japonicus TaxID=27405 RepID=UPI001C712E3D|nr:bestrophin-3-like isoform X2 [Penaeus japonicus]